MGPNGVRLHQFFIIDFSLKSRYNYCYELAWMAKLANAHGLSPCELWFLRVQIPLYAFFDTSLMCNHYVSIRDSLLS